MRLEHAHAEATGPATPAGFLAGAVAAAVWFGGQAGRQIGFVVDDSAISFAVARTLGTTFQLELAPGVERVEPATNLLWCLVLAPFAALRLDLASVAACLGLVCSALAIFYACYLPARVAGRTPHARDTLGGFLAACLPPLATWSVAGLENGLLSLLLVRALLAMADEERDARRFPRSACWLFAAFLTRPDAGLYAAAFGLAKLVRACLHWRVRRQDVLFGTAFALAVLGVTAFRQAYFAWPVPMSFYAKHSSLGVGTALFDPASNQGFGYAGAFLNEHRLQVLVCAVPLVLIGRAGHAARLAWALSVAVMFGVAVLAHGDWMEQFRLLTFAIPLLCVAGVSGLADVVYAFAVPRARLSRGLVAAAACVAPAFLLRHVLRDVEARAEASRKHGTLQMSYVETTSRYFESFASAFGLGTTASLYDADIGGTALRAQLRILDHFGLADVPSARLVPDHYGELREAVFGERPPEFVRLHGVWLNHTRLLDSAFFERMYVRLPGSAPDGPSLPDHNYVRRDVLATAVPRAAQLFPSASVPALGQLLAATLSARQLEHAEPLRVELFLYGAPAATQLGSLEIHDLARGNRSRSALTPGPRIPNFHVESGETLRVLTTLNLPPGRLALTFVDARETRVALGVVTVQRARKKMGDSSRGTPELPPSDQARAEAHRLRAQAGSLAWGSASVAEDTHYVERLRDDARRWLRAGAPRLAAQIAHHVRPLALTAGGRRVANALALDFASASTMHVQARRFESAFDLTLASVLLDPHRAHERRRAETLRSARVTRYDADREVAALAAARQALARAYPLADAMKLLGAVDRDADAVTLHALLGAPAIDDDARRVLARGLLVRGDVSAARVELSALARCADGDHELSRVANALQIALAPSCSRERPRGPLDDADGSFERGNSEGFVVRGAAFAIDEKALSGQHAVTGFRGRYFANSFHGGDEARGSLTSRGFRIDAPAYSFLVAGGKACKEVGVRFVVDGKTLKSACGQDDETLRRVYVDTRAWSGKQAHFELYDASSAGWGHVVADDLRSEPALPPNSGP